MHADPSDTWQDVDALLRRRVPEGTYEMWLAPLRCVGLDGDHLQLSAPAHLLGWVEGRFARLLDGVVREVLGPTARTTVVAATPGDARGSAAPSTGRPAAPTRSSPEPGGPAAATADPELDPSATFDSFVIGATNRFAHAAALAVAELPGQAYNPLFLHGPPGTGKSHLLHAIGHYVQRYGGGLTVRVTTAEAFTNEFLDALRAKDMARFKGHYRLADVVLVDDVQFLEDKARTEDEFFHMFNALQGTGAQLVLTSDRTPSDLDALNERLRERFAAGLVVDLGAPDLPTRLAVLRKRVLQGDLDPVGDEVLERIAARIPSNVRALHGALIRVVAFGSLTGRTITPALADEVLDGLYGTARRPQARPRLDVAAVQDVVCASFSLTREQLTAPSRDPRLSWARQLAMYLARQHTGASLPVIGRAFDRRHSTVLNAVRSATTRLEADAEARALAAELSRRLLTGGRPASGDD